MGEAGSFPFLYHQIMNSLYILTGCSKGLGKAILENLLRDKNNFVVGISRSPMPSAPNFTHLQIDLGNPQQLIDQLPNIFPEGKYDKVVLINNAGWIGEIGHLGDLDPMGIAQIQLINVVAPGILMNEFVRKYQMGENGKVVVNISSGAANKNIDGWSGYSSSKAALNRMTAVAQEESDLNEYGITYYALSPGIVDTPMQGEIRATSKEDFSAVDTFKSYKSNNELAAPELVAEKVIHLIENIKAFSGVLQDVRKF